MATGSATSGSLVADLFGESDMASTVTCEINWGGTVHHDACSDSVVRFLPTPASHMEKPSPRQNAPKTRLVAPLPS